VLSITLLGYFLGTRIPWLRDNIDLAILAILALSVIPVAYEWLKHRRNGRRREKTATPEETPEPATEGADS
jgi:membrane-associated protein